MDQVLDILPATLTEILKQYAPPIRNKIEEIRIRIFRPLEVVIEGKADFPTRYGSLYMATQEDGIHLMNKLSQHSLYTLEEELKRGFITIEGGHRVGLAGKVITESGAVKAIRNITSFNIRIAKQKIGAATHLSHYLYEGQWLNTLIIGAPQSGKTTILRDIARIISNGDSKRNVPSSKIGIIDERSEIAGCVKGIPQHDLGMRVDVLDACPKAEGMMMMIRSMSPEVLIVDEIGRKEDSEAISEAVNAGVSIVATVHGNELKDIYKRPTIQALLEMGVFHRYVELSRAQGPGSIQRILNATGENLVLKRV